MSVPTGYAWVAEACAGLEGTCPEAMLEQLMADPHCVAFGPVHHMLVGAALLTARADVVGGDDRRALLDGWLRELGERAGCVPGGSCARWGVCGAAASAGMARAVACGSAPLERRDWSANQLMVADILAAIARAGAPRCCKRDSRIAVSLAARSLDRDLGWGLELAGKPPTCAVMGENTACMGSVCPYHPAHVRA